MPEKNIVPSAWYFALVPAVILLGGALAVVRIVDVIKGVEEKMTLVTVPGEQEIELAEPGAYTIYHEYEGVMDGRVYSTEGRIGGLEVTLASKEDGAAVALEQPSMSITYSIGARQGSAIFAFGIERPGTYVLRGSYPEGEEGAEAILSVSSGMVQFLMFGIFAAMGYVFSSFAIGVAIAIWIYLKRRAAQVRMMEEAHQEHTSG